MSKKELIEHNLTKNNNHSRSTDFVYINVGLDYKNKNIFVLPLKDDVWLH